MQRTIITAAELPESGELLIPFDAVLTPLARDEAERRGLTIREVAAQDAGRGGDRHAPEPRGPVGRGADDAVSAR